MSNVRPAQDDRALLKKEDQVIRRISFMAISVLVAGCSAFSPSVPPNYTGPSADLSDSYKKYSDSKAEFFVAEEVNGSKIENGLVATLRANRGRGMVMTPISWYRPLVAEQPLRITVKGRTHYAAPIMVITRTVYEVVGVVEFVPKTNTKYIVRGELGDSYAAVWIEDEKTGEVVGNKVEKTKGEARLNFFQK